MRKINPYQALVNPTVLVNEFQGFSRQKDRTMLELDTALLSDGLAQRNEQDTAGWAPIFLADIHCFCCRQHCHLPSHTYSISQQIPAILGTANCISDASRKNDNKTICYLFITVWIHQLPAHFGLIPLTLCFSIWPAKNNVAWQQQY